MHICNEKRTNRDMARNDKVHQAKRWITVVGTVTAVLLGVGAVCYYSVPSWFSVGSSDTDHHADDKKDRPSRCVVVTASLAGSERVAWKKLLRQDVVLLVAPGVSFFERGKDDLEHGFKIIQCNSPLGMWSCVKHLQKDELLILKDELGFDVPVDIPRYVKKIIELDSVQKMEMMLLH